MKMLLSMLTAAVVLVPAAAFAQGGQFGPVQAPKMAQAPMQMAQAPMQAPGKAPFQAPTQAPKFGHHGMPGYQAWSYQPGYAQPRAGYRAFSYQPMVAGPAAGYRTFSYQPMVGPQRAAGWGQAQTFVGGRPRAYTSAVNKALGNVD